MQITPAAEEVLRNLAQVRPGQPAPPVNMTIASELGNAGLASSPGHGGIEITQSGRAYLAVLDSRK